MRQILLTSIIISGLFIFSPSAHAKEIEIPISLDYQLLKTLILQSSYTDPGGTAELINEGGGCIALILSEPGFSGVDNAINFSSAVYLHAGTPVGENCLMPYEWTGSIEIVQMPQLNSESWDLSFKTVDTKVYSSDGQPINSLNLIWNQLVPVINSYTQGFSIKLRPPIQDLKSVILPLFSPKAQVEAEMLLNSIRPGSVTAGDKELVATIVADAVKMNPPQDWEPIEELTEAEFNSFLELWETWDSLLVYLVSILSEQPLTEAEKRILIDLILDTRYEFVAHINDHTAGTDFVRDQFLEGWVQLSQIFRKYLLHNPEGNGLGYLSFITAADALMILDELGPTFGIEISRNGLIRLARILGGETLELIYSPQINRTLQLLFEANSPPEADRSSQMTPLHENGQFDNAFLTHVVLRVGEYLFPSVYADTLPSFAEIKTWQVPSNDLPEYLIRVRDLLKFTSTALAIRKDLSAELQTFYHTLVPAVAWQESCFRQFVVADKKLTYLLSSNKSSIGIMQVNERVWRGIYDTQRLRWDIKYNAGAGCEIIDMYLQKYALAKSGPGILSDEATLAQLVYAMYNGGPRQYDKFLKRKASKDFYQSDNLFKQKYSWVKAGSWDNIEKCL